MRILMCKLEKSKVEIEIALLLLCNILIDSLAGKAHLKPGQTSLMKLFSQISQRLKAANYFPEKSLS